MAKKRNLEGQRLHHFELSDKNRTVRWVLIIILLVIAAVAITWALTGALQTPAGWQSIAVSSGGLNCSHEFALQYDLGAGDRSATDERKELSSLYGQLTRNAWHIFYAEAVESEIAGVSYLNSHPNQEVVVDAALYQGLQKITADGNRAIYFGPVCSAYDGLFLSDDAFMAQSNDPTSDPDTKEYVQTLANFANDPQHVALELRGENRVFLKVSSEYQRFLTDSGVQRILDFGWMRNAFVIDYLAQQLEDAGFTNGYLFSVDGFIRNLDKRGTKFSMNLVLDKQVAAVMDYPGSMSIIALRSYPLYKENSDRYYTFEDGRTVSAMIDLTDGQSKCATDDLISYAADKGCAELAISLMPLYVADTLSEEGLNALTQQGVHSIWKIDNAVCYNQQDLQLTLYDSALTTELKK